MVAGILVLGGCEGALAGHPAAECQRYAQNAVRQLQDLTAAGCAPKQDVKIWSADYNEHYRWCSSANGDLGQEFKKRRLAIEKCQRHSDAECRKYADNAVAQTTVAIRNGCPKVDPPRWTTDPKPHYDWCRADLNGDLGQEFKQRRLANEACLRNRPQADRVATISAIVTINANSQRVLRVTGGPFTDKAAIRIDYTWVQSGPGLQRSGSGSYTTTAAEGNINAEFFVNCTLGITTTYTDIVATDLVTNKKTKPVPGGSC